LSNIPDKIKLLPENVLKPIKKIKKNELHVNNTRLELSELLITLSICSVTNPVAAKAMACLPKLKGAEAHATYIVTNGDRKAIKDLKINLTCENVFLEEELWN
jgi:uncharacterized protein (UPF0371 family)